MAVDDNCFGNKNTTNCCCFRSFTRRDVITIILVAPHPLISAFTIVRNVGGRLIIETLLFVYRRVNDVMCLGCFNLAGYGYCDQSSTSELVKNTLFTNTPTNSDGELFCNDNNNSCCLLLESDSCLQSIFSA